MKSQAPSARYNLGTPPMALHRARVSSVLHPSASETVTHHADTHRGFRQDCHPVPTTHCHPDRSLCCAMRSNGAVEGPALRLLTAAIVFLSLIPYASASQWTDPSRDLAKKIAEITGPGVIALEFSNRSSLTKADAATIKTNLEAELTTNGIHLTTHDQASASAAVTLSENIREYVWLAEITAGKNEKSVVIVAVPRAEAGTAQPAGSGVVLRKQLLWTQEDAILDVAMLDSNDKNSGSHMAILDGSKVTLLHSEKGKWQKDQVLPIQHDHAWPRDLRGRLVVGKDHLLDAYLPGVFCTTAQHGSLALECAPKDDPWPIDGGLRPALNKKTNYFSGTISPALGKATSVPAFYSALALPRDKYTLWVFTAVDGTVHALDGMTDQIWRGVPWGSDIAAVHTGCGSSWQIAAAGKADTGNDELKVYDIPDREPMPMSAALTFPGKITALWAGQDAEAVAVIHNQEASRYEAYRVLFTCGD
jgi:hypothetical protein